MFLEQYFYKVGAQGTKSKEHLDDTRRQNSQREGLEAQARAGSLGTMDIQG